MTVSKRTTGYSIYSAEAAARTKRNMLNELYPKLPANKYDIIYADPPWDYGGKLQFDRSSTAVDKLDPSRDIFISSAGFQYPTLSLEELAKLQVESIAQPDCLLFMWATSPHLDQAIKLGQLWGFKYRTVAFIWDKMVHNPGKYTLSNCELCLVFKRGKIPSPRGARNIQQLQRFPRTKHSEKPAAIRDAVSAMFPLQKRIELFARKAAEGWENWGLDVQPEIERPTSLREETVSALQQQMF